VALGDLRGGAGLGETFAMAPGGYIDSAIPVTQFRLRYDAAYNDNRPDRAEFFYAKCGCFPGAPGPPLRETRVDYQDISGYLEIAPGPLFSGFVDVPFRFLNPEQNNNTEGFADMFAGFKAVLLTDYHQWLTFQFRTAIPTGAASRGLGTHHVSLEPALLYYGRLGDRLRVEGEFRDWIPVGGTDFAGNILRYGVGVGYDAYRTPNLCVTPVVELVGWTVLSGKELDGLTNATLDAAGDTIVNAKFGVRAYMGQNSTFYVGYGRALTGAVWYKDIFRVEYAVHF
jgi:hypothetical protein